MEPLLVISASNSLPKRLDNLFESSVPIEVASGWQQAHQRLTKTTPAIVLIDADLLEQTAGSELVQLNNVLNKDDRTAYFLGASSQIDQWVEMFDSLAGVVERPGGRGDADQLRGVVESHLDSGEHADDAGDTADDPLRGEPDQPEALEVVVRLPKIESGTLDNLPLGRVLYSLLARQQTGILELSSKKIDRSFAFQAGRFVDAPNHDSVEPLKSAFAWNDGQFEFHSRRSVSGSPNSTYSLMIDGLSTHRTQRQLMQGLMSRMQTFPVCTQLWKERRESIDWSILKHFLDCCDGANNLETIFSRLGSQVTDAFRAAAFARDTDLVVFQGEKTDRCVEVQYDHDSGASSTTDTSGKESKASSKVERATGEDSEELEQELRSFLNSIDSMSSHDVFGVWEGCGREVVKETYYGMVKEHHPDVYGGNVSGEIRSLAQEIFVNIRNAYTELLKTEDEQTHPPPDSFDPSQPPRQRRRQQMSTLHPGQARSPVADQQPGRVPDNSTPIGLGDEPSSVHPDLEAQKRSRSSSSTGRSRSSSSAGRSRSSSSTDRSRSSSSAGRSRSSSSAGRSRSSSSVGDASGSEDSSLGDQRSDPEWRKQRLERLQRSKSRKRRRSARASTSSGKSDSKPPPSKKKKENKDPEKQAQEAFNTGYKHYKNDRYSKALPHFEKAHKLDSDHGLYMTFLAHALFQVDPDEANRCIELLDAAIETKNRQALPDAHLFLGNILKVKDSEHRAYQHFKRALELNPGCRDAEREIRLYERRHKDDEEESGGFFKKLFKK